MQSIVELCSQGAGTLNIAHYISLHILKNMGNEFTTTPTHAALQFLCHCVPGFRKKKNKGL